MSISSASIAAMSSVSENSWHELHESDLDSGHDADTEQAGQEDAEQEDENAAVDEGASVQRYWANQYTALVGMTRRIRHHVEVLNLIGQYLGIDVADTYWCLHYAGSVYQFVQLENPAYSDAWCIWGWVIEHAAKGSYYFVGDEIKELECHVGDVPSELASSGSAPAGSDSAPSGSGLNSDASTTSCQFPQHPHEIRFVD